MTKNIGFDPSAPGLNVDILSASTFYNILNVDSSATRLMIREAYLRLKHLYANGSDGLYGLGGGQDSSAAIAELDEAFAVLNDDTRRADYDKTLGLAPAGRPVSGATWSGEAPMAHEAWTPGGSSNDVVQTARSTLKVIKTRASRSDDYVAQDLYKKLLVDVDLGDGSTLIKLRELVGVTEAEMHDRTKITLDYLRAIEHNRFERLPQVVYVKGFMRSYLKYLNVPDADRIISAYAVRLEAWQSSHKV